MWATQIFYVLKTLDRFPRPLTTSIIYLLLYFTIAVVCTVWGEACRPHTHVEVRGQLGRAASSVHPEVGSEG